MKTMALVSSYLLATAVALGQGSIALRNKILGQVDGVDAPFFDDRGVPLEGPKYVVQIYAWKTGDGFQSVASPLAFATNGYFYGELALVPFVGFCAPAWVQVRAWESQGGASFEQAALAGAWTGVSDVLFLPQTGTPEPRGLRRGQIDWPEIPR